MKVQVEGAIFDLNTERIHPATLLLDLYQEFPEQEVYVLEDPNIKAEQFQEYAKFINGIADFIMTAEVSALFQYLGYVNKYNLPLDAWKARLEGWSQWHRMQRETNTLYWDPEWMKIRDFISMITERDAKREVQRIWFPHIDSRRVCIEKINAMINCQINSDTHTYSFLSVSDVMEVLYETFPDYASVGLGEEHSDYEIDEVDCRIPSPSGNLFYINADGGLSFLNDLEYYDMVRKLVNADPFTYILTMIMFQGWNVADVIGETVKYNKGDISDWLKRSPFYDTDMKLEDERDGDYINLPTLDIIKYGPSVLLNMLESSIRSSHRTDISGKMEDLNIDDTSTTKTYSQYNSYVEIDDHGDSVSTSKEDEESSDSYSDELEAVWNEKHDRVYKVESSTYTDVESDEDQGMKEWLDEEKDDDPELLFDPREEETIHDYYDEEYGVELQGEDDEYFQLFQMERYQKDGSLLIPKEPFSILVREILQDYQDDPRMTPEAIEALQHAAEAFLIDKFRTAINHAVDRESDEIVPKDMHI